MKKVCRICKEEKDISLFEKSVRGINGVTNRCAKCKARYVKAKTRNIDPEKRNALQRRRYHKRNSVSTSLQYIKEASLKFRRNNYELNMLLATKSLAKKRGFDFNLTIEDVVVPERCPYLNIELTKIVGGGRVFTNPSIDRIDNSKGYVKGNVRVISTMANSMKLMATIPELVTFAKNVLRLHDKKI